MMGMGETDVAVYQSSTGNWFVVGSSAGFFIPALNFGGPGFVPVPGDYDGDGETDAAVYQSSTGNWFVVGSSAGFFIPALNFGGPGFVPVLPQVTTETGLEAFAGTYSGTFSGDDSGTWTAVVDSTGNVTGSGASSDLGNFLISGNVTGSGAISFTAGTVTTGANFSGTISLSGEVSGSWENALFGETGTFSGSRQ